MAPDVNLEALTIPQLTIFLEHVKGNEEHLKKCIDKNQFDELLKISDLSEQRKNIVKSDIAERAGNTALVINTILTTIAGTWLGAVGFLGLKVNSVFSIVTILIVSILASSYLGYLSYKSVRQQGRNAIVEQKLNNIQVQILEIINNKLDEKMKKLIRYLNKANTQLATINETQLSKNYQFNSKTETYTWFNSISSKINNLIMQLTEKNAYNVYVDEILKIRLNLQRMVESQSVEDIKTSHENQTSEMVTNNKSFIEILTKPSLATPKEKLKRKPWWRSNLRQMGINLAPTALGGFAFITIYFDSIPKTAGEVGIPAIQDLFTNPRAKLIELYIGLVIMLYFAFTHIYNHRKSMIRNQEIELIKRKAANYETTRAELNNKLGVLRKLAAQIKKLQLIIKLKPKAQATV